MESDLAQDYAHRHVTAAADRVSWREKIGLGFGKAVVDGTHGTLHVLLSPIYNMTLGLNPALISTVVFIQRLWDAMLDPMFGQYSDNYRSRWGRRRPLLLVAALPVAALFTALWWFPRGASGGFLFSFLLIVSLAFYAAHSLFAMPLGGLIVEATDDYHERTKLAGVTLAFGFAVQVGSQWIFPLTKLSIFHTAPAATATAAASAASAAATVAATHAAKVDVNGTISGVRWVSIGCGILFLLAALAPVVLCRERMYKRVAVRQQRVGFMTGLRAVRGNASFLHLLVARSAFSFGFNVVGILGNYMYVYQVFGGDVEGSKVYYAMIGSSYHVAAIVTSLWLYPWVERRIGKRRTMQGAAAVMLVGCVGKTFLYQPGWIWLPLIVTACNGVANAGVALMSTAMLGDIADYDEWQTGLRREGLFNSLLSWFDKAGNSLGSFLTGFILVLVGFDAKLGGQSGRTLWLMKISYVIAPAVGALLTVVLMHYYRLTQDQLYAIKDELAQRRTAAAAGAAPPAPES